MKKFLYSLTILMVMTLLMSNTDCKDNSSNAVLAEKQEQLMQEANRQVGMPAVKNFQMRKLMKMIIELQDQSDLVCYCYLVNEMNGSIGQFMGKCIGYGLPYSTQFTNPQMVDGSTRVVIPQADPDGLFKPSSAEGTWVMLLNPKTNEPHVVYFEPRIIISPFPLK